jgi:hypothetical protein
MAQTDPLSDQYRPVFAYVVRTGWPVALVVASFLAYFVAVGDWPVALATGVTLLAAAHAFVGGIALGGGDAEFALVGFGVAAAILGGSIVLPVLSLSGALVFAVGSLACLVGGALGYAAWEQRETE